MNLSGLRVSSEAMGHFQGLWKRIYKSEPKNWKTTLHKFLKNVKEVEPPSLVPVLVADNPRYFVDHSGWLFVTSGAGENNLPLTLRGVARSKAVR